MRRLVIRQRADEDLDGQLVYLARQSRDTAERFFEATEPTFRILADSPGRGFVWNADGVCVWPTRGFTNWLVFYRPIDDGIEVIRLLHGARDLSSLLNDEP